MTARSFNLGYALLSAPSPEHDAALGWLRSEFGDVTEVRLDQSPTLPWVDVLWVHVPDGEEWRRGSVLPGVLASLRAYVESGGRILCTNRAAYLPHDIGIEPVAPEAQSVSITDEGYGRGRGFQSFGHHPLFDDLFGGGYVWNAHEDHEAIRVGYFGNAWPKQGHVLGVDKAYITLDQDSRLIVEHRHGEGAVLSVGGYVHLGRPNRNVSQLHRFLRSALDYLAEAPVIDPDRTWRRDTGRPVRFDVSSAPLAASGPRPAAPAAHDLPSLSRERATDAFFDVAGRRCVVMGEERGGIDEVWCHPFRILHDLEVGVVADGGVTWLKDVPASVEVFPHALVRRYQLPNASLEEVVFTARAQPAAAVRFQSDRDLRLIVRHATDFRWMWPYREGTLGSLHYGYDEALGALHVRDRSAAFYALFGADRPPQEHASGPYEAIAQRDGRLEATPSDANVVRHAAVYALTAETQHTLLYAVAGSNVGRAEAEAAYRRILEQPAQVHDESAQHFQRLLASATLVTSPDATFNEGYRWAVIGTDRFWAETPGIGVGLLAGYGTTKRGWDGGHAINGRPGYGWYFARDAAWACFAVNGYGDFASVREELRMFERYQDASGKMFFELPLSGVVHYDSADATPLYLILAAHYLRASGDVATIEALWPSLLRAMDFLYTTDTNGDGFIENRNVGHGWIEGGPLFGARTEIYLAGLWVQALRGAAYMAGIVGDEERRERFARDAEATRARLEDEFWDEEAQFLRFAKLDDGSFSRERTISASIPLMFHQVGEEHAEPILDAYASNEFSADWGTHIVSKLSELFSPRGYHYGAVWPLFTGWTALAEYAYRRPVSGFTHVMNNLLVYRHWALGFIEEVLNGERYEPTGVCAHQCWSETNVLHPVLTGMLGLAPDAPHGRVRIAPQLPADWDRLAVTNIHVGATSFDVTFVREGATVRFHFEKTAGPDLDVTLDPRLPLGTTVRAAEADVPTTADGAALTFRLEQRASITFATSGGIGAIPHVPRPSPGDETRQTRIIDEALDGDVYTLVVEGAPGETAAFRVRSFGPAIREAAGAELRPGSAGLTELHVRFPDAATPWVRAEVRLTLDPTDA